jgi:MerR family mercuric resistance operon transcriptional regulator
MIRRIKHRTHQKHRQQEFKTNASGLPYFPGKVTMCTEGAGVLGQTVRFYVRQKLLREPARKESVYRIYGSEHVKQLEFILQSKAMGFSLAAVREILEIEIEMAMKRITESVERSLTSIESLSR